MLFREYVYFETGELFEKLANPFEDAMDFSLEVIRRVDVMRLFKDYRGMRFVFVRSQNRSRRKWILGMTR